MTDGRAETRSGPPLARSRRVGRAETAWFETLGAAAQAIGTAPFYECLLGAYCALVRNDMATMVRY